MTTTNATAQPPPQATTFDPYVWFTDNNARLTAEIASDCDVSSDTVAWLMLDIIHNERFPSRALPLPEFEAAFKVVARDAALRRQVKEEAADAEWRAQEVADARALAEEEEQAHDDARKRRAERKQARKARQGLATLAPSAAKRARRA